MRLGSLSSGKVPEFFWHWQKEREDVLNRLGEQ
jgi:hypothetical protein